MKIGNLLSPEFNQAFTEVFGPILSGTEALEVKTLSALKVLVGELQEGSNSYDKERKALLEKYAKKNEETKEVEVDETGQVVFEQEKLKQLFAEDLNTLLNKDLALTKLKLSEVGSVFKMSFQQYQQLSFFFE